MDRDNNEKYTVGEEIFNAITHGVGTLLSIAALVLLIVFASIYGSARHVVSFTIYGVTLVILYLNSTLYHSLTNKKAKNLFEIFDHSSIYLLIAGTYTPFTLVTLKGTLGWTIFGIIWGLAAIGIVFKAFFTKKFLFMSTIMYVLMGWIIILAFKPLLLHLSYYGMVFLVVGGVLYTVGAIFYVWRKLKFGHGIWHLFVLGGSICHFFSILLYVR